MVWQLVGVFDAGQVRWPCMLVQRTGWMCVSWCLCPKASAAAIAGAAAAADGVCVMSVHGIVCTCGYGISFYVVLARKRSGRLRWTGCLTGGSVVCAVRIGVLGVAVRHSYSGVCFCLVWSCRTKQYTPCMHEVVSAIHMLSFVTVISHHVQGMDLWLSHGVMLLT